MALIPHECFHPDQFRYDTDTSKVGLHLDPSGYLASGPSGLRVNMPTLPPSVPAEHFAFTSQNFIVPGSLNGGIVGPGADMPVSDVMVGGAVANPFSRPAVCLVRGAMNATLLPASSGTTNAELQLLMATSAAATYNRLSTTGIFSDNGQRTGSFTAPWVFRVNLAVGQSFTPHVLVNYVHVFNHAAFLRCSSVQLEFHIHTL